MGLIHVFRYTKIDVFGKTAPQVADELIGNLGEGFKGGVLVLVGLSGTGKGTTVDILKKKLPNCPATSTLVWNHFLTCCSAPYLGTITPRAPCGTLQRIAHAY